MSEQGSYYIIIPGPVKVSKVSANAKLLFGEIAVKCNLKGYCWATNQYFADVFSCDVRSIQRYIKELEDANFVAVEIEEDPKSGVIRKIRATILSHTPPTELSPNDATELSPPPTTKMSCPPMTTPSPPHDTEVSPPHDKNVVETINNSLLVKENSKRGNKKGNAAPVNGTASAHVNGSSPGLFTDETTAPPVAPPPTPPKAKTLHPQFIEIYSKWFKDQNEGMPPKIEAKDGAAAKSIISHLRKTVTARAEKDNEILDDAGTDGKILSAWEFILNNWEKLELFYQQKTRLVDINSNLQNIITQIRNKNNGKQQINGNHSAKSRNAAPGLGVADYLNSLNDRFGSTNGS